MKLYIYFILITFYTSACVKNEIPEIQNQEELITTVSINLIPENNGNNVLLLFKDIDGDGGIAPTISENELKSNSTYIGTLSLLDESKSPVEDITVEIQEESEEHQFFYKSAASLDLQIEYLDFDANNNPIGLKIKIKTGNVSQGNLKLTLRHEPEKMDPQVQMGDISNAGGETDIEIDFPLLIK